MAQMPSDMPETLNVGSSHTSYQSLETHYNLGQLNPEADLSDNLPTTPSKLAPQLSKGHHYKPTVLRMWYHGILIICLALFLGLTEYAIQTLLAKSQEALVSQLPPSIKHAHQQDQHFVPHSQESSYKHLARVPSNATFGQAGVYSTTTGHFSTPEFSSSTLASSTDWLSSSTGLILSQGEKSNVSLTPSAPSPYSPESTKDASASISTSFDSGKMIFTLAPSGHYTKSKNPYVIPGKGPHEATTHGYLSLVMTTATIAVVYDPDFPPEIISSGTIAHKSTSHTIQLPSTNARLYITPTLLFATPTPTTAQIFTDGVYISGDAAAATRGHVVVQSMTTDVPAKSDVLEAKVTTSSGETLVAVPVIITTIRGGLTQVLQTTFVDSEGRMTTSLYTTVAEGESVLATHTYFIATSLAPGWTVLTVPTAILITEPGKAKTVQTVSTESQGHVATSSYTTTLNGIQTLKTVPVVFAIPVSSGDKLVTVSTVIPTTVGGSTKVIKTTSTESQGHPTTFSCTIVEGGKPTSTTVWTIATTSTSTSSSSSNGTRNIESVEVVVFGLELRDYLLGAFLPTVLAAVIAYPFKLIHINARLMQPFHELAAARKADGVSAEASIFLRFYDFTGALSLPRSARLKQPVLVISDLLVLGAALLAPIAAETVSVQIPDVCDSICYGSLGVTIIPGRVLEALLAIMMALLIALVVVLHVFGWETGVSHNPRGIAGIASLGLSPGIKDRIRKIPCSSSGSTKESLILKALDGRKYALDKYQRASNRGSVGARGYGIVVKTSDLDTEKPVNINEPCGKESHGQEGKKKRLAQPFALLTWWGRCTLLFTFACVLIIATYYETTSLDSGFERFMDSRGFGIRFFFTALGVVIGGCMETFFRSVAVILPYQLLSKHALPAGRSILLSPPTNAFYGIFSAFRQQSFFLGAVSFATILAELLLPITLSHVPFSHLDTYETQIVCSWLTVSILAFMILVILYSFFIRWPYMPVDPRTVAGAMFYVCDSWMLETMEGVAALERKQRDALNHSQRLKYGFAISQGVSGKERMKVDFCGEALDAAVMLRDESTRGRGVANVQ